MRSRVSQVDQINARWRLEDTQLQYSRYAAQISNCLYENAALARTRGDCPLVRDIGTTICRRLERPPVQIVFYFCFPENIKDTVFRSAAQDIIILDHKSIYVACSAVWWWCCMFQPFSNILKKTFGNWDLLGKVSQLQTVASSRVTSPQQEEKTCKTRSEMNTLTLRTQ